MFGSKLRVRISPECPVRLQTNLQPVDDLREFSSVSPPDLHLYFHIPFCHRICPYCGFYKHQPGSASSLERFVQALGQEVESEAKRNPSASVETLYFGGGTPSLLFGELWKQLASRISADFEIESGAEWTIEANPRTFDTAKAETWRKTGVTRVSLGVQSMDSGVLETLGRDHAPEDVAESVRQLRKAGFDDLNIDLMFAIPGQTLEIWCQTLQSVVDLNPNHISAYNLTYEEDTAFLQRFESGDWTQDPDRDAEFFALAHQYLGESGFGHYEVSNYARPGHQSSHNQAYWAGSDYRGFGPSAVSTFDNERWKNVPDTEAYVTQIEALGHARADAETLTAEQRHLEKLALGLRTENGVPLEWAAESAIDSLVSEGLAEISGGRIRLTLEGMMVADEVAGFLA